MSNKNLKKIVATSLAIVTVASSTVLAAGISQRKLNATFGKVKFKYNGTDVTSQVESKYGTPGFLAESRSYVPVRALAEVMGITVTWDAATNTAILTSKPDNSALLQQQISYKDAEIARLNAEIKKLKDGETGSTSGKTIREIESKLQKDYGSYERISFDIDLSGDKKDVDLKVQVDLGSRSEKDRWEGLSNSKIERLIEDMVKDIQKEYKDAYVEGYIRDKDSRDDLYTFKKKSTGKIEITNKNNVSKNNLKDFEKILNKDYEYEFSGLTLTIKLEEYRKDEIEYTITVEDYNNRKDKWTSLADSEIEKVSRNITNAIEREFRNTTARGSFRGGSKELANYRNSKFTRYE